MIRKQICKTSLALLSFIMFALPVKAADDSVALQVNGNKVEATFQSGTASGAQEEILSLQLSFALTSKEGKPKKNEVTFEFNSAIQSVVAESRYQESTGVLNIYVSGSSNILTGDETSLGKVIFSPSAETAQYSVKVVENSLKTVNKAFYMEELPVIAPIEGNVTIGGNNGGGSTDGNTGGNTGGSGGGTGGSGGSGGGSNDGSSGDHKYDDWYSDEEDGRRPDNTINNSRPPESFVTNQNPPVIVNPITPTPAVPPDTSQTPPANNQVNNLPEGSTTPAPAENQGTQNSSSPSGTGNGSGSTSSNADKNGSGEDSAGTSDAPEGADNHGSVPAESEATTEGESVTEEQTQKAEEDTEASAQPDKTQDDKEKKSSKVKVLMWVLVIVGMVVSAAAVATAFVLVRRAPKEDRKNLK